MRLDAQGAIFCQTGVTEQGQGAEAVIAQCVATRVRRADRARARHHRRHRQHALWRRHLGLARGRHRRRSGLAGRQGAARERARRRRLDPAGQARRRSTSAMASSSMPAPAPSACRCMSWPASPISVRTRCRRASRPSWWRRATTCRAPGRSPSPTASRRASSRSTSIPASSRCSSTGAWRTAAPSSIRSWSTSRSAAAWCRGSAARCSSTASTTSAGSSLNGNMADYLVPMAAEMPDIEVGHVVTPTADCELGAKGAGEAGTAGAPGAVMNAINDALRPLGAEPLTDMPFTPGNILRALRRIVGHDRRLTQCGATVRSAIARSCNEHGKERADGHQGGQDRRSPKRRRSSRTGAAGARTTRSARSITSGPRTSSRRRA